MKKILYILIVAFASSLSLLSCTEEEVTPKSELAGGGGAADPL